MKKFLLCKTFELFVLIINDYLECNVTSDHDSAVQHSTVVQYSTVQTVQAEDG